MRSSESRPEACASVGHQRQSQALLALPPLDTEEVDFDRTYELTNTFRRASGAPLGIWANLPDGAGMWSFQPVGASGPPMFYPFMARANVSLAFVCTRWGQVEVILEPWLVLCWCPAGYIWPYCMLCHKFCFPIAGQHAHLSTRRHVNRCERALANQEEAWDMALSKNQRFAFFRMD